MKDLLFNIYRYNINKERYIEPDAFNESDNISCNSSIEYFEKKCLGNKDSKIILREIVTYNRADAALKRSSVETSEKEDHTAHILEHRDGIFIIKVDANKHKMLYDVDFNMQPHDDHQPFLILIDNRPSHQYVAIQQGVMKTDNAARLLIDTFNYNMKGKGLKFEVLKLHKMMTFHESIFHIKERLGRSISKISFEFDKRETTNHKLPAAVDHFLKEWIGRFADEGKIEAAIKNDEKLKAQDVARDLEMLGRLCLENAKYKLSAWFGNFGVYRYGKEFGAQFGINGQVINDFINPPKPVPVEQSFLCESTEDKLPTLGEWLEKLHKAFDDYEKTSLSISGRGRRNRRPL